MPFYAKFMPSMGVRQAHCLSTYKSQETKQNIFIKFTLPL